jgi:hypothetical protein
MSRKPPVASMDAAAPVIGWDGRTIGAWTEAIDGAAVVINLCGRSLHCRLTSETREEIYNSRVDPIKVIGKAIASSKHPPECWLQMSDANIYSHRYDAPNDEFTGMIGGQEIEAPESWRFTVRVTQALERALDEAPTPKTRKIKMRTASVMDAGGGGTFDSLLALVRHGFGGPLGTGRQYVSWVHFYDFERAIKRIVRQPDIDGAVNISAPHPLPYEEFIRHVRKAWKPPVAFGASAPMVELAARIAGTQSEFLLKSRRVTPGKLLQAGFEFVHPTWPSTAEELVDEWRRLHQPRKST